MVKAQATITLSRVDDGSPGVPGRTYFLEPSTLVLKKGQDNVISPGTVDFKAFYRDGNSASRTAYAGRFKIEETTDGTTWKTIYTSKANESSVKHSTYDYLTDAAGNAIITASGHGIVAAVRDIHMIRCTLYAAGGTTNALDTQSVTVVKDVKALTQEEVFNILTNNGVVKGIYMENGQLYISFTYAKGGILVLGGRNDGNGLLEVHDAYGKRIGYWGKDGIIATNGLFSGEILSTSGGSTIGIKDGKISIKYSDDIRTEIATVKTGYGTAIETYGTQKKVWLDFYVNGTHILALGNTGQDLFDKPLAYFFNGIYCPDKAYINELYFNPSGGYLRGSRSNIVCYANFNAQGTISCTGTKSRKVKTQNYDERLLYCYETPSPMFGDVGEAVTDNLGICYIYLDDIFTETINTGIEYQVFLQKEGPGDLWVDSKESAFFIVKGTPNLRFSWEIKAKQRDYEYERLEDTEAKENDIDIINYEEQGQKLFEEYLLEKETAYEGSN